MEIIKRELKANRISMLIWASAFALLLVLFLSTYPSFSDDVEVSKKILQNLPPMVSTGFGLSVDSFFSIYGFLGYLLTFASIAGAIQAMSLGVAALSKEESGKTVDFLLVKPISRASIVSQKLVATLLILLFSNVVFIGTALIMSSFVEETGFDVGKVLLVVSKFSLVQLFFLALGFLMSVIIPKIKSVVSVSLPTVFGLFIIGTIGAILEIDSSRYLSPFKFFDSQYAITNGVYETQFLAIEALFVVLAIAASYMIYTKKDISTGY